MLFLQQHGTQPPFCASRAATFPPRIPVLLPPPGAAQPGANVHSANTTPWWLPTHSCAWQISRCLPRRRLLCHYAATVRARHSISFPAPSKHEQAWAANLGKTRVYYRAGEASSPSNRRTWGQARGVETQTRPSVDSRALRESWHSATAQFVNAI